MSRYLFRIEVLALKSLDIRFPIRQSSRTPGKQACAGLQECDSDEQRALRTNEIARIVGTGPNQAEQDLPMIPTHPHLRFVLRLILEDGE